MDCCVFLQVEFQWEFDLWGRTTVMIGGSGRHDTEKATEHDLPAYLVQWAWSVFD